MINEPIGFNKSIDSALDMPVIHTKICERKSLHFHRQTVGNTDILSERCNQQSFAKLDVENLGFDCFCNCECEPDVETLTEGFPELGHLSARVPSGHFSGTFMV